MESKYVLLKLCVLNIYHFAKIVQPINLSVEVITFQISSNSLIVTMNSDRTCQILSGNDNRILGYAVALNKITLIGDVDYWTSIQHRFYRLLDVLILRLHIRMTDIVYMNYYILEKKVLIFIFNEKYFLDNNSFKIYS